MNVPEIGDVSSIADRVTGRLKDSAEPETQDPRDSKTFTFDFEYRDPRGRLWRGRFTNRILTVGQRRQVKVIKASLSGGVPVASLDADVWELNEMLAHLSVSLDRNADGFPAWAQKLDDVYDEQIIRQLYAEVMSHEDRFHRRGENHPGGQGSSENQSG